MFDDEVKIEVSVRLPWAKKEVTYGYAIGRHQAREALVPLPKDREIDPAAMFEAQRQHERRERLIDLVAQQIAGALMTACESQDTDHGYPKGAK